MKHSCNTFTQGDEKGIAGQARNDSSFRMKTGILFCSLLLSMCFFSSCSKQPDHIQKIFNKVENFVEQQPDSALHLLYSILLSEELNKKQFNKYNLLLLQAKDKCYKDITADTVIYAVKDYYVQRKDYPNAALAAFYRGRVLYEKKEVKKAASAYLEGKHPLTPVLR